MSTKAEGDEMLKVVAEHGITIKKKVFKGLDKIPELMKLVESGKMSGKGVIVINEEDVAKQKEEVGQLV